MEALDGVSGTQFQFTPSEVAEMEDILTRHNGSMPTREVHEALAEKLSFVRKQNGCGQGEVQEMQVREWFERKRDALNAKDCEKSKVLSVLSSPTFLLEEQDAKRRRGIVNGTRVANCTQIKIIDEVVDSKRGTQISRVGRCIEKPSRPTGGTKFTTQSSTMKEELLKATDLISSIKERLRVLEELVRGRAWRIRKCEKRVRLVGLNG
ncbi:unnamed protein product [Rhodiola kirilowii]